jgi:site-specific DNA-methyltransferase (adenine-specific)
MTDTATPLPFTLANHDEAPTRGGSSLDAMPCCGSLDLRLVDCMDVMKNFPDGHFGLAVVDPPYGIGEHGGKCRANKARPSYAHRLKTPKYESKGWDKCRPPDDYWQELFRVSSHQIVFGANYFTRHLPPSMGWVFWDKKNEGTVFSDGEFVFSSFDRGAKIVRISSKHGTRGGMDRIHPTQKPVKLYGWLLSTYAKPGMRVLDTHLGSGSIAIAAHYAGVHLTACEIDPDYFEAAKARIERETAQTDFFIHHNSVYSYDRADRDQKPGT